MFPKDRLGDRPASYGPHDTLCYAKRFGPEAGGRMHQVHYARERGHETIKLLIIDRERWRYFQHHEIVTADLTEYSVISKQMHDQYLAEQSGMNFRERIKRHPKSKRTRGVELDCV
jgi:hypothetical protein